MRGSAVTLAQQATELATAVGLPDVIVASDFLNLAEFKGFADQALSHPRYLLYMHENQLCYPLSSTMKRTDEFAYINWKSMCLADQIYFNSRYHKESLLEELQRFLQKPPDHRHTGLLDEVRSKTQVLPVGVELTNFAQCEPRPDQSKAAPTIVWNQRWEYDKNPDYVFATLARLAEERVPFSLILLGEDPREQADKMLTKHHVLQNRIVHAGYANASHYRQLLRQSDIVVSAPRHEYFGISVVEAIAAGALPVLPNGLSYPEIVDESYHEWVLYTPGQLYEKLVQVLTNFEGYKQQTQDLADSMQQFNWDAVAPRYDKAFTAIV